jgi:putative hydrolase of the HAD superfamily
MTTRAIIFDYGNVLDVVDDMQSWLDKREMLATQVGMTGDQLWEHLYYTDPWQKVKRGQIPVEEFHDRILRPLGIVEAQAQSDYMVRLKEGRDKVHPGMAALLYELKPHYRLGLLSNTDLVEMETWIAESQGLPNIFDVVVSSAKAGMAKPEPEIYHLALKLLEIAPEEALFIDDLPRNTIAAEALGIPSIIFESPAQLRHELEARGILPKVQPNKLKDQSVDQRPPVQST